MAKLIKGGYKNVSLNNVDLATNNLVVDGLYNKLNDSYGKPIQLCGVVIDNVKKKNAFVQISKDVNSGNIIVENIYGLKLTITNQDAISVENADKVGTKLYKHSLTLATTSMVVGGVDSTAFNVAIVSVEPSNDANLTKILSKVVSITSARISNGSGGCDVGVLRIVGSGANAFGFDGILLTATMGTATRGDMLSYGYVSVSEVTSHSVTAL